MPKVYDDWERLVQATLRKQELWELFHEHSRTPSGGSTASASTTTGSPPSLASPLHDVTLMRSRLSPLRSKVTPSSSAARVSPLNSTRFKSEAAESSKQVRRSKSRMRLDRWILTRWLSKTFHSTSP